jgi:hypothetical protein
MRQLGLTDDEITRIRQANVAIFGANAKQIRQELANKEKLIRLAKERIEQRQAYLHKLSEWKEPNLVELLQIKEAKAYKGLKVIIDGKPITLKTFTDYLLYAESLSIALRKRDIGIPEICSIHKLTDDQTQALLQIAQTGDKAATLAFIQQALPAGE